MTLLALLISTDDSASDILGRVLPAAGIAVERFSDLAAAIDRLQQQRFDALILDFEDAKDAAEVFEEARRLNSGSAPVTVALVAEHAKVRDILSNGAHFVLYKPLSEEKAAAGLRAVTALLNRERRRAYRVPVQAPVELTLPDTRKAEGILLDLSETGMDVLTAEPQTPGALLNFRFQLPDGSLEILAHGQVAWANPNGQTGVHFLDLDESIKNHLQTWLLAAASIHRPGPEETVPHCKLTDLSLGGCYVETDSPFPEHALVDLCLRTEEMAVHTEGMVRVNHPGHGMGVEFPSRTPEQRAQVGNLISLLRSCPESMPELSVSPRALVADLSQFESAPEAVSSPAEDEDDLEDPLLELLRHASAMQEDDFLEELRRQRSGESVAT
ncbi:MAG: PilZ domain-containing protein [Candidatus Sulfotelmatobacter sp.]|jgi:DNA-binding response OmpR family regulator